MIFEDEQLTITGGAHLNCGRQANYFLYSLKYKGKTIGSYKRGREGKEQISLANVDGKEFTPHLQKEEFQSAVLAQYAKVKT